VQGIEMVEDPTRDVGWNPRPGKRPCVKIHNLPGHSVQTSRESLASTPISASQARDVSNCVARVRDHHVSQDERQQATSAPSCPGITQVLAGDGAQEAREKRADRDRVVRATHLPSTGETVAVAERGQQKRNIARLLQLKPQVLGLPETFNAC
jgi:hypothetical protein